MDRDDDLRERDGVQEDDLTVGLTRQPTVKGVPLLPLLYGEGVVFLVFGAVGNPLTLLLCIPVYFALRLLCASNPRIFDEIGAWLRVNFRCRNWRFWGAASFSPRRTHRWGKP